MEYLEILHYHIEERDESDSMMKDLAKGMVNLLVGEDKSNVIYKSALH